MSSKTFLIIEATANPENPEALKSYLSTAPVITKKYGGVLVVKYNVETVLDEGDKPGVVVVMSFTDRTSIDGLFNDPAYKKLIPLRDLGFSKIRYFICNESI